MKLNSLIFISTIILSISFSNLNAQVTFSDSTILLVDTSITSGVSMGIADMNGDGLDDIIRLNNSSDLEIEYQSNAGVWTNYLETSSSGSEWSMCVADVDRNGYNDIFRGGANNGLKLYLANTLGSDYTVSVLSGPSIFLQGSNFADIDNNGTIDIFACHDNGVSSAYNNDGTGVFTYDLGLINAVSTVPSDNSGNYGSTWTDYDNDGDLDLYLSKCRLGVSDPNDGRRLNMLFQNDGNNNYTDVAAAAGLLPFAQSWATDFADIDNDGDLDVFMINHDSISQFYLNNGNGTYTNITAATGTTSDLIALGLGIQCKFVDFDNDSYLDLLITGTSGNHLLLWNNGDLTFTAATNPFSTNGLGIQSAAIGDLNHDGFIDIIAGFATGFNGPSNKNDMMFYNNGNSNNFISFQLTGTTSNINGIGAKIELYGSWGQQIREIRAGESYGVFNSFTMHFGIGIATEIDSAIIRWPSGIINKICSPNINTFLQYTENTNPEPIIFAGFNALVNNLSVSFIDTTISAPIEWLWNFGDGNVSTLQNPTHTYNSTGNYTVCLTVKNNCTTDSVCQIISVITTNITQNENSNLFRVYPNPTSNQLTIISKIKITKINILDVTGKVLKAITSNLKTVDVSGLSNGVYFIELIHDEKTIIQKFIKQ